MGHDGVMKVVKNEGNANKCQMQKRESWQQHTRSQELHKIREEKRQLKKSMDNKTKDNKMKFINCVVTKSI